MGFWSEPPAWLVGIGWGLCGTTLTLTGHQMSTNARQAFSWRQGCEMQLGLIQRECCWVLIQVIVLLLNVITLTLQYIAVDISHISVSIEQMSWTPRNNYCVICINSPYISGRWLIATSVRLTGCYMCSHCHTHRLINYLVSALYLLPCHCFTLKVEMSIYWVLYPLHEPTFLPSNVCTTTKS